MKVALVVTSGQPVVGREAQAIDSARAADAFWRNAAAEGKCSEPEWFWSSTAPAMTIVKGEAQDMQMLLAHPRVAAPDNGGTVAHPELQLGVAYVRL